MYSQRRHIMTCNGTLAKKVQQIVQREIVIELGAVRLHDGAYIGYTNIQGTRTDAKQPRASFGPCGTTIGSLLSPMASVGEVHSCPPAQSSAKKLQIRPVSRSSEEKWNAWQLRTRLLSQAWMMKQTDDQRPRVVAVGRGPTKLEIEHQKRESRREDETPHCGRLRLHEA